MDPALSAALDAVVARTGHERYRQLCDPSHPDHNPAFIPIVLEMAGTPPPAPPPSLPGLATLAKNAVVAVATHVARGMPSAPDDVYEARLKVCGSCPNLILPGWRCGGMGGCGCYLKVKARWAGQACPLGKWPA